MKIGNLELTPKITNRVIWDIEDAFDSRPISLIMSEVEGFTLKQMGILIWQSVKGEISFDDFADNIQIGQYAPAATEVGEALAKAFDIGVKKK